MNISHLQMSLINKILIPPSDSGVLLNPRKTTHAHFTCYSYHHDLTKTQKKSNSVQKRTWASLLDLATVMVIGARSESWNYWHWKKFDIANLLVNCVNIIAKWNVAILSVLAKSPTNFQALKTAEKNLSNGQMNNPSPSSSFPRALRLLWKISVTILSTGLRGRLSYSYAITCQPFA
jgi:hypothetical protein